MTTSPPIRPRHDADRDKRFSKNSRQPVALNRSRGPYTSDSPLTDPWTTTVPDQPSLFDLDPPDPAAQELPTPQNNLSTTPKPDDTDLPLPLRGRSGNSDDAVIQALRAAGVGLETIVELVTGGVEAPPLKTVDRREVLRWVERAADRMIDPDQGRRLRRTVLDLLDAQLHLNYHAKVHARRVERLAEIAAARAAGTYWRDRDARRTSTRPIHVDVDPAAWAALKAAAIRSATTLGEMVGCLVRAKVKNLDVAPPNVLGSAGDGPEQSTLSERSGQATVFTRIASNTGDWTEFKALAIAQGLPVSRAVGVLVEEAVRRTPVN